MYNDGVGAFSLDEEGRLIWQDDKDDAGKDMRFEWVSEYNADFDTEEADG